MSDTGRQGGQPQRLLVSLLIAVVVVGLTSIERVEGRRELAGQEHAHEDHKSICELPHDSGENCGFPYRVWSYVKSSGKCKRKIYRGCGGNANRFGSKSKCQQACLVSHNTKASSSTSDSDEHKNASACMAQRKLSTCNYNSNMEPKFAYFDADKGECELAPRNSCVRGENAFRSSIECQRACLSSKELCGLPPKVAGKCKAFYKEWSYVKSSGKCETFTWGGCGGNANRFESQSECEKTCLSPSRASVSTTPRVAIMPLN